MTNALERLRKWIAAQPMKGASGGGNHTGLDLLAKALDAVETEKQEERERWVEEMKEQQCNYRKAIVAARAEGFARAREMAEGLAKFEADESARKLSEAVRAGKAAAAHGYRARTSAADTIIFGIRAMQDDGAGAGMLFTSADVEAEVSRRINTPETEDFMRAVPLEAAHQQQRWATEHDAGKADGDWFWLLGYLGGKALRPGIPLEKKRHHIISLAAACLNWHRHTQGVGFMRPGIEPPADATRAEGEAFPCCGGSDESPPEHTQDCHTRAPETSRQGEVCSSCFHRWDEHTLSGCQHHRNGSRCECRRS